MKTATLHRLGLYCTERHGGKMRTEKIADSVSAKPERVKPPPPRAILLRPVFFVGIAW